MIGIGIFELSTKKGILQAPLLQGRASAPSSRTSRPGAAWGLVGGPHGVACVTRICLQSLPGRVAWAGNVLSSSIDRGDSHDKRLLVNIWDSITIYLEKFIIRESIR